MDFSVENFKAQSKNQQGLVRLYYGKGETGWGIDLGDDLVAIANMPLEPRLHLYDVVKVTVDERGWRHAGDVVWRGFACKTGVEYPKPHSKVFKQICDACSAMGLPVEGFTPGSCGIHHGTDVDLEQVLAVGGVDTSKIKFRKDWSE